MKSFSSLTVIALIALCLSAFTSTAAATPYTPHHFISTAQNDPAVIGLKAIGSQNAPRDTPYIERIELRAGLDNLDDANQEYRLRIYPRAWGETAQSRQLLAANQESFEVEKLSYLGDALKRRYELVLTYIEVVQRLESSKALEKVYADRAGVLQKKISARRNADVGSLISTEDKRIALQLDIVELQNRVAELTETIHRLAGHDYDIAFNDKTLISMARIKGIITGLNPDDIDNSIALKRKKNDVERANCRAALEKAKSRDYFNYFQVGHTIDADDDWQKKTSVEVGLRLPFTHPFREAIWERQTAFEQERYAYNRDRAAAAENFFRLQRQIKLLLDQYEILGNERRKAKAVTAMRAQITAQGGGPLELLKLNESLLENQLRFNRLAFMLRSNYIELLDLMGMLTSAPLIDYLSNDLARL